jgi:hypothetical protein
VSVRNETGAAWKLVLLMSTLLHTIVRTGREKLYRTSAATWCNKMSRLNHPTWNNIKLTKHSVHTGIDHINFTFKLLALELFF